MHYSSCPKPSFIQNFIRTMCFRCCWYFNMCVHTGKMQALTEAQFFSIHLKYIKLILVIIICFILLSIILQSRERISNQQSFTFHSQFCCLALKSCSCTVCRTLQQCNLQVEFVFQILWIVVNKQTDINLSPFLLCIMYRQRLDNDGYLTFLSA